ncbi:hypothetical protein D3C77_183380 [compost metagenome]
MKSRKYALLLAVPCLIAFTGCDASSLSPGSPSRELGVYQESSDGNVELKILDSKGQIVVLKGHATESEMPPARKVTLDGSKCGPLTFLPQDAAAFRPHRLELTPNAENCESLNLPLHWNRA